MSLSKRPPVEYPVSAGGVVYRWKDGRLEVVLCGQHSPPSWRLPKGTPNLGEGLEETARREVEEETGLKVQIEGKIGQISYWFSQKGIRYHKTVHFFLMSAIGGDTSRHDPEFDEVAWFPIEEACARLTFKNEVEIVQKAQKLIESREERS